MNERYTKLFSLSNPLYLVGAPVVIEAGALLKDNVTEKVLAQLKIANVSNKKIKSAKIKMLVFDIAGNVMKEEKEYQYLDLSVDTGTTFGAKTPIELSDNTIRSFKPFVKEVIFDDNSSWISDNVEWEEIHSATKLEDVLGNAAEYYRSQYGEKSIYLPQKDKDLWRCSCGVINHENRSKCRECSNLAETLFSVDLEEVKTMYVEEQERQDTEREEARQQKHRKIAIVLMIISVILLMFAICRENSNSKRAERIYNSFLGQSFSDENSSDDGFLYDSMKKSIERKNLHRNNRKVYFEI